MGKLIYDSTLSVEFDDRVLAHLRVVLTTKRNRGETFVFTWGEKADDPDGLNSLCIRPGVELAFVFRGARVPAINQRWIRALLADGQSRPSLDLHLIAEPDAATAEPFEPHGRSLYS
ncbi:DUF7882 family protein [Herbiconiux liangxiaofengii]|uniref:DUF7882 family protein n=1 Tax=Herbiconiux liangxiaofengii TaxID=3342795 RepID=UPI0035B96573